ncbi:quinon protein alcohol dehydrogenase-like superfamily [Tribonema minus]|uniref:Quinon protein alcohol dehydrogenase-like superfamily n=1 Tax=Tribonema minus TaxID=303371 RepID=A0A836CKB4_9STRA|nr:quinon protein alcohol dehydrogenase-like superfamily [Tribonema minus]
MELEHAVGFRGIPGGLHYHPNGKDFVYAAGATVVICDLSDPHAQSILVGHTADISCLALGSGGDLIASGQIGGDSPDALVWDFASRTELYRLSEHDHGIQAVAFSDDDRLLCTAGVAEDGKVLVWDMSSGAIVALLAAGRARAACVAWGGMVRDVKRRDTRGYQLATAGDQKIVLWTLDPYTGEMQGARVAVEGRGATLRDVTSLAFSDDRESLYCTTTSGDVLPPDRLELLAGTDEGFVYRVRVATLDALQLAESPTGAVRALAYAPGVSDKFATAAADGALRLWDASDYTAVMAAVVKDAQEPLCLALTEDMVVSGWRDGRLRAHDADTGKALWLMDNTHVEGVTALALSRNQRFALTGGQGGELRVWELRSRELVSHLKQHGQRVPSVALFSDDAHAVSVSRDRSLICWDLRTEKQVSHHSQRMGGINGVALSKDESLVLTVGQEKRMTQWDLRAQAPVSVTDLSRDMSDEALGVAVSHNGRFVATAGTAQVVKLWDLASRRLLAEGRGHSGSVTALSFSADDRQLVSAGLDGNVLVWNVYE